jgi:hypothetical protein
VLTSSTGALLALGLFGCSSSSSDETGLLSTQDPYEYTIPTPSTEAVSASWTVHYMPSLAPIPLSEPFDLDVVVRLVADGSPLEGATLVVDAHMPIHDHGMFVETLTEEVGGGIYRASPLKFHMEGWWTLLVDITADGTTESVVFNVDCCE